MKKLLATILALVMALGVTTISWAEEVTLPDGIEFTGENTLYWMSGETTGYASTLKAALDAAHNAAGTSITVYCKEGATITGSAPHIVVTKDLTIYAFDADFGGNDISIGRYKAPVNTETTINIYNAKNLVVWGQPVGSRADVWNVNFYDCHNNGSNFLMYRDGETGKAKLNLTMTDCTATGYSDSIVHTTADGAIIITNCEFSNNCAPINVAHKQSGSMEVTVTNCKFNNCGYENLGDNLGQYAAPVRIVNNSETGTVSASIDHAIFTGTKGANGDILLGDGRTGKDSNTVTATITNTAAEVQTQQPGYYNENGEVAAADNKKSQPVTETEKVTAKVTATEGSINAQPAQEQPPRYYYNSTTTTDTKTDTTKGSPKTFDAGVGIYALTAVLSVTGMAWTAKKRH